MAGSDSRFDPERFRTAIRFAMEMGFPDDSAKQITWSWNPKRTFNKADSGGLPLEWKPTQVVTESDITSKIVDCSVRFVPVGGATRVGGTELGIMDIAGAVVTLLDVEYDALLAHGNGVFPENASMDGNRYVVQIIAPPYGLFDVTIYDVHLQAIDES